jgi:hypothetical protein
VIRNHLIFSLLIANLTLAIGCGVADQTLPRLGPVTIIKIVGKSNEQLAAPISDQRLVSQIIAFVDADRQGWNAPLGGIPVPTIIAEFYDGDTFKGHFGAGRNFFETQRAGGFFSKNATPNHVEQFLQLLGVPKDQLRR